MNALKLKDKGLQITYRSGCFTSWLELSIVVPIIEINSDLEANGVFEDEIELASSHLVNENKKSVLLNTERPILTAGFISGSTSCGKETTGDEHALSERMDYENEPRYENTNKNQNNRHRSHR
jgi:hypothetical protein